MDRRTRSRGTVVVVAAIALWWASAAAGGAAGGWTIVPTPNPGATSNSIGGVVAFGSSEVWAVGQTSSSTYSGCHGRTLTLRYTGTTFTEVPNGNTPMCASVEGVAGTSTSDIWGVGSTSNGRETFIRHWNGSDWAIVPGAVVTPPPPGRAQRTTGLNAVAALTASDVWAVGRAQYSDFSRRALIEHWNGSSWMLLTAPGGTGSVLDGVATVAASDAWAVGWAGGTSGAVTLAEHWNGSAWTIVPTPNVDLQNFLHGVAAFSTTDVWAVGDAIRSVSDGVSTYRTLIERWNGSAWSVVPSPNVGAGGNSLAAVVARSATDVWAVGYYDDITGSIPIRKTLTMHWNGTAWAVVASPNLGTGDNWLTEMASSPASTTVWASGVSAAGTLVEKR